MLWLSSPNDFNDNDANVSNVNSDGGLYGDNASSVGGVRPSISLKSGTTSSGGNGTVNNPYLIEGYNESK